MVKAIEIVTVSNSESVIPGLSFLFSKRDNLIDSSVRVADQMSIENSITSQRGSETRGKPLMKLLSLLPPLIITVYRLQV